MNLSRRQFAAIAAGVAASRAASGATPAAVPPNFVILFSDQQHWQAMGCVDKFFDTPNLDWMASHSALFERSFCTTPQCSPSRSSLFTGLYPSKTGVFGNIGAAGGNNLRHKTIGAHLQSAGYQTAYFGKWHLGNDPAGNAGWNEEWRHEKDAEVTPRAVAFLRNAQKLAKPFALVASYLDPHDVYQFRPGKQPFTPPVPLSESWRRETFQGKPAVQKEFMTADQGRVIWGQPQPEWERYRALYREKVRLFDTHAGHVLRAIWENGLWDNTIVIVTSDHGDMDTNHKLIYKGPFMYEHMVRVPMMIRVPASFGGLAPRRIRDLDAVNVDIAPTILDFAGLRTGALDGVSLRPTLTGKGRQQKRDFVIGQYYSKQKWVNPIRMIRTAEFKYNRYIEHGEELYDLRNDPHEITNLAADRGYAKVKQQMSARLKRWMAANQDPFPSQRTTRLGA